MASRIQKITLEKIAKDKLTKQKVKNIDSIELEVWEKTDPGVFLRVSGKSVELRLNYSISTKKFFAWVGVITATITGVVTILKWLTPILISYYANSPP